MESKNRLNALTRRTKSPFLWLVYLAAFILLRNSFSIIETRNRRMVPSSTNEIDMRLQIYDEIFHSNPSSIKDLQRQVRIRQNCTEFIDKIQTPSFHPDSQYVTASCRKIHYRAKQSSFRNIPESIAVGVLSDAKTTWRRNAIRKTWGQEASNVFFIVAGPFEAIEQEYEEKGDLIWVDQDEVYLSDTGGLTLKTYVFFGAMYDKVREANPHIKYFLKTDDDVYVNMLELTRALETETNEGKPLDYWGTCYDGSQPSRNKLAKFFIAYPVYPFAYFPPYCIGLGYVISQRFLDCAVRDGHLARVRFIPLEDVAAGMLAERCSMEFPKKNLDDQRNRLHWNKNKAMTMRGKIMQHNVKTTAQMLGHHESAVSLNRKKLGY